MDDCNSQPDVNTTAMHRQIPSRKKQKGQIIIMMMFAAIPLLLLMAYVFNGGYLVAQKTKLQNTADTAALMETTWTARTLNIMSMNNTALTQSQAIASAGYTLERHLMDSGLTAGLVAGFYVGRIIGWAKKCTPWCPLVAGIVYIAMYIALNEEVLKPLYKLQLEVARSMHTNNTNNTSDHDQGFAKAAASFAKMNRILVEEFPKQLDSYSRGVATSNYNDNIGYFRYLGWAEDSRTSQTTDIPVVEQSLRGALETLTGTGSGQPDPIKENSSIAKKISDTATKFRDLEDVFKAGLEGTQNNPYGSLSLDYFGNFSQHGYANGLGPYNALRPNVEREFSELFFKLEGFVTGGALGEILKKAFNGIPPKGECGTIDPICWGLKIVKEAIIAVFDAIFRGILGTAYENQATTPEELTKGLTEVWEWNTKYGESNYSNAYRAISGSLNILVTELAAPPRTWRGIIPGIYHGQDLTNYADTFESAIEDVVDNVGKKTSTECVDKLYPEEERKAIAELNRKKDLEYEAELNAYQKDLKEYDTDLATAEQNGTAKPQKPTKPLKEDFEIKEGELNALKDRVRNEVTETCEKAVKDGMDAIQSTAGASTDNDQANSRARNQQENEQNDRGGDVENDKKTYDDPIETQNFLESLNWLLQPAYSLMRLSFPLDATAHIFDLPANQWCAESRLLEGIMCINDTPMYAVRGQRIYPEIVGKAGNFLLAELGMPANIRDELKDTLGKSFAASRADWSMLVALEAPMTLPIAGNGFGATPPTMTVLAQAEVYNTQWFDLFTQNWRAKLTPISLLRDDQHIKLIKKAWKNKVELEALIPVLQLKEERLLNH